MRTDIFHLKFYSFLASTLLCLLPSFVKAQSEIVFTQFAGEYLPGDSARIDLSYRLILNEDEFATVSLQRKMETGTPFYQVFEGATGDVGEGITAGENKLISWEGPFTIPFDLKLYASVSPKVEILTELVNQIDSNRMKEDLLLIEGIRHRNTGEANLKATQDLIKERFASYGFSLTEESFPYNGYEGLNIIGSKEGCSKDDKVWLIGGHYDTVDNSPGADDNGSAIVGMLEAARVLSLFQFEKRIAFVAWDLEEEGLLGSIDFVERNKDSFGKFEGYLNFEMIGYFSEQANSQTLPAGFNQLFPAQEQAIADDEYKGNFITNVGNTQNSLELMQAYEAAANIYVPDLKVISVAAPGIGAIVPDLQRSDHTPFWREDIPALMLSNGANFRNENYHGPEDVADSLNFTFMSNVVKAAVATIAQDARPTLCYTDSIYIDGILNTRELYDTSSLQVSPNPASSLLTLTLNRGAYSSDDILSIINSSGTRVRQENLNKDKTVKVDELPSGVYYIILKTKTGTYTSNFVIQR